LLFFSIAFGKRFVNRTKNAADGLCCGKKTAVDNSNWKNINKMKKAANLQKRKVYPNPP